MLLRFSTWAALAGMALLLALQFLAVYDWLPRLPWGTAIVIEAAGVALIFFMIGVRQPFARWWLVVLIGLWVVAAVADPLFFWPLLMGTPKTAASLLVAIVGNGVLFVVAAIGFFAGSSLSRGSK